MYLIIFSFIAQYVFPGLVTLEYKPKDPMFYTFMSTNSQGFTSFFHCLIIYDEINEAEIANDFDCLANILKKQNSIKKINRGGKNSPYNDFDGNGIFK